jgi:hypothetical protein
MPTARHWPALIAPLSVLSPIRENEWPDDEGDGMNRVPAKWTFLEFRLKHDGPANQIDPGLRAASCRGSDAEGKPIA